MNLLKIFSKKRSLYVEEIQEINKREESIKHLDDDALLSKSLELKARIKKGKTTLKEILPDAFALVREASWRTLKQRHYDVQLVGGIAIFNGKIVEMKTGEGKTLAATSPVFLHALSGNGVHVITVNDYLAQRDAVWMGQIYNMLGLSVACIIHDNAFIYDPEWKIPKEDAVKEDEERDILGSFHVEKDYLKPVSRKDAYLADIIYGTNNEFGFDYLRDNLAYSTAKQVQRGHYFAVIDEVDSVLIDEARTPMIISAPDRQAAEYYQMFAKVVSNLKNGEDYEVFEKDKVVQISDSGIEKAEKALNIDNIYSTQNMKLVHYLDESLKAKELFKKDKQYVVKDGQIIIVDEFTGRMMHGRRYSGGLHQAIEAKEGVRVQEESKTFAQITIQNYFRLYKSFAGMTGTAKTSEEEFLKVYGMEVVEIPTNKPNVREDMGDVIYRGINEKYKAITNEVKKRNEKGQPVLIGTTSIDENELLSKMFSSSGIFHEVLNAKNHEREGEIIAQAGKIGAVTLATNMAGRGVDIVFGGNPPDINQSKKVKELGGLFVLGTQRNESRRIDNQLRGRAGRQGDPGESIFFLSLEDDLLRVFGGDKIKSLMQHLHLPEDQPIESKIVVRAVNEAQKKVEGMNFDVRKHLLEYDDVLNKQRSAVYRRRQLLLEKIENNETKSILSDIVLKTILDSWGSASINNEEENIDVKFKKFKEWLQEIHILEKNEDFSEDDINFIKNKKELPKNIIEKIDIVCKDENVGMKILSSIDVFWTNHLDDLEALLEAVRMRAYGQKDPLVEYKRDSFGMFKELMANANAWAISSIFQQIVNQTASGAPRVTMISMPSNDNKEHRDIGRNDPCWCGSGKKYKKCHGA